MIEISPELACGTPLLSGPLPANKEVRHCRALGRRQETGPAVPTRLPAGTERRRCPCRWCWARVAAFLRSDLSSSLDIYSIARNEREEVDDNMFPVLCFVQIPSRQHVCVCEGLSVLLSAASKQGSSKIFKAYSPLSNTALTLETVHGFDTPVGFLPTSLCQRYLGLSSRLHLAFAGGKRSSLHRASGPPIQVAELPAALGLAANWGQPRAAVLPQEHHSPPQVALDAGR